MEAGGYHCFYYYTVAAVNSGKCLSVSGASVQNNATVVQWDCVNATNQEWRLVQKDSGYFSIEARHSGKCLSVAACEHTERRRARPVGLRRRSQPALPPRLTQPPGEPRAFPGLPGPACHSHGQ